MPSQPCSPTLAMNLRRRGVSTIWAMFSRVTSNTSGIVVCIEELLDLLDEFELLRGELEVHERASIVRVRSGAAWFPD
jgi:hypothetical protein